MASKRASVYPMASKQRINTTAESVKIALELKSAVDQHAIVDITDPQGVILEANDQFCALFQFARSELVGRDHRIVNSGQHPAEFFRRMWTTIAGGEVWRGEIENRAKDGSRVWVETTIVPILGADGAPRQYFAIRTDITEKKRAEQALLDSEEQLRLALKGANAAAWQWNVETCEAKWSPQAYILHGQEPGSVVPSYDAWLAAVHPEDRDTVWVNVMNALQSLELGI